MKITNPQQAIKAHCKECCGGVYQSVKDCPCTTCALYPFRLGENPFRKKRKYTDEQLNKLSANLGKSKEKLRK